jgi:uncharacterized protein (DUF433 family)
MQLEDYFDFLAPDDIRVRGSQIGIETILYDYLYKGMTSDEIAIHYRALTMEQICATLTYYWRNQAQMDAYLVAHEDYASRLRDGQAHSPSPAVKRLFEILQRRHEAQLAQIH